MTKLHIEQTYYNYTNFLNGDSKIQKDMKRYIADSEMSQVSFLATIPSRTLNLQRWKK